VVEGAYGADWTGRGASGGDMTVAPTVLTLRVPGGRVGALDRPRVRKESDRGAHREHVPWVDGDNDGGGSLAFPGSCVGVEISGGEDTNVFGVEDGLREAREKFLRVLREESNRKGVDGELSFVGGEAEGQPGRISHGERLVELGREGVEIRRKGCGGSGRVGDEKGDRSSVVNLGGDSEGEDTVRISEDASGNVGEGGSNQGRLGVLGGGRTRCEEPSLGRRE